MLQPRPKLTNDLVFKAVFGRQNSTAPLRALLSAVEQDAGNPPVAEVEVLNPFNLQRDRAEKLSVIDIRARDVNGRIYAVEMQATAEQSFVGRTLLLVNCVRAAGRSGRRIPCVASG